MKIKQIPNILSIFRIILTVPIVFLLLNHEYFITLWLFLLAGITDALDGYIAKKFNFQTWIGSILDPLADKILLISSFISLFLLELIPLWFLAIILFRDIILIAGMVGYYYNNAIINKKYIVPSNISKLNTVLQILVVLSTVFSQIYNIVDSWLITLYIITATSTVLSGVDYAWLWICTLIKDSKSSN